VRITRAESQQPQVVAEELDRLVVLGEARVGLEQGALVRLVDVTFQRQVALGLRQLERRVEQREQLDVARLGELRALQERAERAGGGDDDRQRVGNDERADRRAEDDDELERLEQHHQVAAAAEIAADDAADDDGQSQHEQHEGDSFTA
jgi:hypothetical protein